MSLLERIYYFHEELSRERYPNANNLVEQFEVSLATARRDIAYLRDRLLAPLEYSATKTGFYYTDSGFNLPFENSPKITFLLGMLNKFAEEAGLGGLDEVKKLEKRLTSLISPEYQTVANAIHCEWVEVENIQPQIFEAIIESIVKSRQLEITYRSTKAMESKRVIESLKLLNYQGRWYLLAYCCLRKELRFFHIARITAPILTKNKIEHQQKLPTNYLEQSFGIFKGDVKYNTKIHFSGIAAELIAHQHWHKDQKIEQVKKGIILTLPVSDDREIMMKILQYGSMAKVLEPKSLQEKVEQEIEQMSKLYK